MLLPPLPLSFPRFSPRPFCLSLALAPSIALSFSFSLVFAVARSSSRLLPLTFFLSSSSSFLLPSCRSLIDSSAQYLSLALLYSPLLSFSFLTAFSPPFHALSPVSFWLCLSISFISCFLSPLLSLLDYRPLLVFSLSHSLSRTLSPIPSLLWPLEPPSNLSSHSSSSEPRFLSSIPFFDKKV